MLEPQAENPHVLLEHHKARAELDRAAGDLRGAYWHGRQIQKIRRLISEQDLEDSRRRARQSSAVGYLALEDFRAGKGRGSRC